MGRLMGDVGRPASGGNNFYVAYGFVMALIK